MDSARAAGGIQVGCLRSGLDQVQEPHDLHGQRFAALVKSRLQNRHSPSSSIKTFTPSSTSPARGAKQDLEALLLAQ